MTVHTAICAAVKLPARAAPEWVHLLPVGAVDGRDGRRWRLDYPASVIGRSIPGGDLPIDMTTKARSRNRMAGRCPLPAGSRR